MSRPFFLAQTHDAEIVGYGVDYASICLIFSFGIFAQFCFERLLQSTGRTKLSMMTQLIGAVINIVLDPILIFGWFGLPRRAKFTAWACRRSSWVRLARS